MSFFSLHEMEKMPPSFFVKPVRNGIPQPLNLQKVMTARRQTNSECVFFIKCGLVKQTNSVNLWTFFSREGKFLGQHC